MKSLLRLSLLPLTAAALCAAGADFHDRLGMQLWSLRAQMAHNESCALDLAEITGVKYIETAGTGRWTVAQYSHELRQRGLEVVSAHLGYPVLAKDIHAAIADAKTMGAKYIICPMLPKPAEGKTMTLADAHRYASEFNAWGEACRAAGLQFGYHPHGYEFVKVDGDNTAFDVLVRETKPELVCYEMDVFWVAHAGEDPVALLNKYPDRWRLMHVKDMSKESVRGHADNIVPPTDDVAVGTGQLDWPSILATAEKVGVQYYFLEDETTDPLHAIPSSLQYLRALKL